MPVQTQLQQRRGTAASWTSTNPTLAAGEIGFESDTGKIKIGTGSTAWNALAYTASSTAVTYLFNATASQTTFSGTDANGLTLAYTVGSEQVYLNGVLQVRGSDYTATNGTSIVLTSGALVSDVLNVIAFSALALSDTYTQAQADAKFFQTANAFLAGKNKIINGDFTINQRAFTSTTTTNTYGQDRWSGTFVDGTTTYSTQAFTPGSAPVSGYEGTNYARLVTTGQTLATAQSVFRQRIEDVRTFAGQTVTVSFWAQSGSGTPNVAVELIQSFGTGGSPSASVTAILAASPKQAISTTWTRYSYVFSVPSISGKTLGTANDSFLQVGLWVSAGTDLNARTGSLGIQTNTFNFWGFQAEACSIATPFQTATGTIQGELAACQRYYFRNTASAQYSVYYGGAARSTTIANCNVVFPVEMRVAPTSIDYSNVVLWDYPENPFTIGALAKSQESKATAFLTATGLTGLTASRPYYLLANTSSSYIGFSAEL